MGFTQMKRARGGGGKRFSHTEGGWGGAKIVHPLKGG